MLKDVFFTIILKLHYSTVSFECLDFVIRGSATGVNMVRSRGHPVLLAI